MGKRNNITIGSMTNLYSWLIFSLKNKIAKTKVNKKFIFKNRGLLILELNGYIFATKDKIL